MNPADCKYSREHEWVKMESDDVALVGITHFAQEQLGDIVFVYFPDDLASLEQFKSFGEIESPKAVSELFAPISGEVMETNADLQERPELVNEEPYGGGWMLKVRLADPSELDNLMTADQYEALLSESEEA